MEKQNKLDQYQGELLKYTNIFRGWQNRWFVLDSDTGVLSYYVNEPSKCKRAKGNIVLKNAIISTSDEDPLSFSVMSKQKSSAKLRAKSMQERNSWMEKLAMVAERHSLPPEPVSADPNTTPVEQAFQTALGEAEQSVSKAGESYFYLSKALDNIPPFGSFYNLGSELKSLRDSADAMQESLNRCIAAVRDHQIEAVPSKSKDTLKSKKSGENMSLKIPPSLNEERPLPIVSSKSRHCISMENKVGSSHSSEETVFLTATPPESKEEITDKSTTA